MNSQLQLKNTLRGRFGDDGTTSKLGGLEGHEDELRDLDRIIFVACGTARHACMVGEYLIERLARVPVEVEHASEFRYRNSPNTGKSLVIAVSQSGETLDTLEAVREAKTRTSNPWHHKCSRFFFSKRDRWRCLSKSGS